ncbi:zinc-binding dehydrogenase [soil metagenome]
MKAAYINEVGPPDNIRYGDLPEPVVGELDVLVKVAAVAVNPVDTYIRKGIYSVAINFPFIIGRDMSGIVTAVGAKVTLFKPGDRVWTNSQGYDGRSGTFAEFLSINESLLYALPEGCEMKESVAVLHSALTAVVGLFDRAQLKTGETIFINGGSGNVGTAVLQIAKASGARVAVTAGSADKISWCKELGADLVIDYKTQNVKQELLKFAPQGVDIYWNATQTPDVELALSLMARRGRMVIISGLKHRCEFPNNLFYTKNCTIYGFTITDRTAEELSAAAIQINSFLSTRSIKTKIYEVMPLSRAADAHRLLEQGDLFGKVVLVP